jgi:poly(3-hydroxybutyrate) depolymerase
MRDAFAEVDQNGDGRVSLEEHMRLVRPKTRNKPNDNPSVQRQESVFSHWKHADLSELKIRQTWPQEPEGFDRTAIVSQPKHAKGAYPVVIFFHGAGGNAAGPMRPWESLTYDHVVVSAQGYRKTWNIHGEPSKAPDVEFFKRLLKEIKKQVPHADLKDVSLIGFSNGSGFIHRLLIEVDEPFSKRNFLLGSSLIEQQYHDGSFWKPTQNTDRYDQKVKPKSGRMLAYFHGTKDRVVPYNGGKRGRFPHLSAQETTYAWAKANGYSGQPLGIEDGRKIDRAITALNYPETQVTHYQVAGGGHGFDPHNRSVRQIIQTLLKDQKP